MNYTANFTLSVTNFLMIGVTKEKHLDQIFMLTLGTKKCDNSINETAMIL